jgi:protein KRI1
MQLVPFYSSDSEKLRGGLKVKRRAEKFEDDAHNAAAKEALNEYFGGDGGGEGGGGVSKEDMFLRDFLLNEKWREDENKLPGGGGGGVPGESSEEEVEEAEKFEQSYNFRFEEPEGAHIVSHARRIEGTVRREKTGRRDQREQRKERKLSEKERLKAEVRRLKNLKRQEIQVGLYKCVCGTRTTQLCCYQI